MQKEYHVVWKIEVYAENETEAAAEARKILLDPESEAVCFEVAPFGQHDNRENFAHIDLRP